MCESENLSERRTQTGAAVELPPVSEEEDEDEQEDEEEPLSVAAADDEDDEAGGVAIAPPPPAPPESEGLSDQLRYAITLFEDEMHVLGHWADRARARLGEAPVAWGGEAG